MAAAAPLLWLRAETKPNEHRSALVPSVVKELVAAGFTVKVEQCTQRFFDGAEFAAAGAELVPHGSWRTAPAEAYIVGLKELPENDESPLQHKHIFFGHCYKSQAGWKELLGRFDQGKGTLLDMEFLNDDKGRRVAAFGFYAGFAGAAVGLDVWANRIALESNNEQVVFKPIQPFRDESALIAHIQALLASIHAKNNGKTPVVHIMGALGRCGSGAVELCRKAGIDESHLKLWDMNETKAGGPFAEIVESDIFVNCIYLSQPIPPFLNFESLKAGGNLSVLVDVSCDITNPHNPLPVYTKATTFDDPVITIAKGSGKPKDELDIISIDHLPTLLPREASERFSHDLLPSFLALKEYETSRVWQDALVLFNKKVAESKA